jgi:hypothetical protein
MQGLLFQGQVYDELALRAAYTTTHSDTLSLERHAGMLHYHQAQYLQA